MQDPKLLSKKFDDLVSESDLLKKLGCNKRTLSNKRTGKNAIFKKDVHWFILAGMRVYRKSKILELLNIETE